MTHGVRLTKWSLGIQTVHRTRRRVHEVRRLCVARKFRNVGVANEVACDVVTRLFQGMANPCLSCEVHDRLAFDYRTELSDRISIGNVNLLERESTVLPQDVESVILQTHVVVAVHVVDTDHLSALRQESL